MRGSLPRTILLVRLISWPSCTCPMAGLPIGQRYGSNGSPQRALPHKSVFRATLAVMWLLLAIGLMIGWTIQHAWDAGTLRVSLVGLPFMIAGLVTGEYLHHRVDERGFRAAVNLTLILIGVVLLYSLRNAARPA